MLIFCPDHIVTISISRYWVQNIVIFDFRVLLRRFSKYRDKVVILCQGHIDQPYFKDGVCSIIDFLTLHLYTHVFICVCSFLVLFKFLCICSCSWLWFQRAMVGDQLVTHCDPRDNKVNLILHDLMSPRNK